VWGTVRIRALTASRSHSSFRRLSAVLYIGLIAACFGGLAGAMLVGFIGIFCGAVTGGILGRFIAGGLRGTGLGILIGSILGPVFLAFYVDRASALYWGLHAAWVGAILGGLVALLGVHANRR
jgi:ABC-type multidrug transport system permease subunit